jgi:hypothetical protein
MVIPGSVRFLLAIFHFGNTLLIHNFHSLQRKMLLYARQGYFELPSAMQMEPFDNENVTFSGIDQTDYQSYQNEMKVLQGRGYRQIQCALDHLCTTEIDLISNQLWSGNEPDILRIRLKIIELTFMAEKLEDAISSKSSNNQEYLIDEIRVIRSRIRSYCGEKIIRKVLEESKDGMIWNLTCFIKRLFGDKT